MKIWSLKKADSEFSKEIRERDPRCVRCWEKPSTQASHFFEKGVASARVRYDEDNADGVCDWCHPLWEGRKPEYIEYKKKQLGIKKFRNLEKRARTFNDGYRISDAIIGLMRRLGKKI